MDTVLYPGTQLSSGSISYFKLYFKPDSHHFTNLHH